MTASTQSGLARALRALRDAASGKHHDYTQGSIGRAIFLLAVPMVLEMMMESLFGVCDVFFVGRLGANAVAVVGVTESMMILVYTVAMGLSIAASAVVARRVGEKDPDGAASAAVQALGLAAAVAGTLAVSGALFAPQLLRVMGASEAVIEEGTPFARVMLGGSFTAFLLFTLNSAFRGAGDAAISMRVLWLSNALNIALGPLLIFGVGFFPRLGVTGAAVATTCGRGAGVLFAATRLARGSGHLQVERRHLRFDPEAMMGILRMSGNGTFQYLIGSASWIGLVRIMSSFGSEALAAYTITLRLVMFALLPAWGLSNAAATMVGQALGAKDPDRAATSVWTAARYNLGFLGAMGVLFAALAPQVIGLFTQDPAVLAMAVDGLRLSALGFPFFAFGMVLTQAFNGAGDTWTPTKINLVVYWAFEIPVAYGLALHTGAGYRGAFLAVTVSNALLAVVSAVLFKGGGWRRVRV